MKHVRPLIINESLTHKELLDDLKSAKFIVVEYNMTEKSWGVAYIDSKNQKQEHGGFNTNVEVHNFLVDNDIDYEGKEGFLQMRNYRNKQIAKVPFQNYQRELMTKGLENIFDLD